jgi:hypothetical protein
MTDEEQWGVLLGLLVVGIEDGGKWPVLKIEREDWASWTGVLTFFEKALSMVQVDDRRVHLVVGRTDITSSPTITLKLADEDWLDAPLVKATAG